MNAHIHVFASHCGSSRAYVAPSISQGTSNMQVHEILLDPYQVPLILGNSHTSSSRYLFQNETPQEFPVREPLPMCRPSFRFLRGEHVSLLHARGCRRDTCRLLFAGPQSEEILLGGSWDSVALLMSWAPYDLMESSKWPYIGYPN